jgi:hypothetical protein
METFERTLHRGRIGEGKIASWLLTRGQCRAVLPAYEIEIESGKGPRLFFTRVEFVTPDMLVFGSHGMFWVEAKTKTAFTWYRKNGTWQDGIDLRHWEHYLEVHQRTGIDIWLFFLHGDAGRAKNTPLDKYPPSGLFAQTIKKLRTCVDHTSYRHGTSGMVYWNIDSFRYVAMNHEVERAYRAHEKKLPPRGEERAQTRIP